MQICENHNIKEFTHSSTAKHKGLANNPTHSHIKNMKSLCGPIEFLEFFTTVKISSGFRSFYVNQAVGGAKNSSHTKGLGVDFNTGLPNFMASYLLRTYDKNLYVDVTFLGHIHINKTSRWAERETDFGLLFFPIILAGIVFAFRKIIIRKTMQLFDNIK
ncbi:MAG: D-Ala-D-Ala carboxypeptidase family metallohydrolase [Oligoflexales bacterium]